MNDNNFDLEQYLRQLLDTIKEIHDESVANNDSNYKFMHIFDKKEIDNIAEAWDNCKWFEVYCEDK